MAAVRWERKDQIRILSHRTALASRQRGAHHQVWSGQNPQQFWPGLDPNKTGQTLLSICEFKCYSWDDISIILFTDGLNGNNLAPGGTGGVRSLWGVTVTKGIHASPSTRDTHPMTSITQFDVRRFRLQVGQSIAMQQSEKGEFAGWESGGTVS